MNICIICIIYHVSSYVSYVYLRWLIRVSDFASEARRASTGLGTRWGGPSWCSTVKKLLLKSAWIESKLFLLFAQEGGINVAFVRQLSTPFFIL